MQSRKWVHNNPKVIFPCNRHINYKTDTWKWPKASHGAQMYYAREGIFLLSMNGTYCKISNQLFWTYNEATPEKYLVCKIISSWRWTRWSLNLLESDGDEYFLSRLGEAQHVSQHIILTFMGRGITSMND